jgi:hypothetical protein
MQRSISFDQMQELLLWRLVGSLTWHSALLAIIAIAYVLPASCLCRGAGLDLLFGMRGLWLYMCQVAVLLAHRRVMATAEAAPVLLPKFPGQMWVSLLLSRVGLRDRKASSLLAVAGLYLATAVCSTTYVYLHYSLGFPGNTFRWSAVSGIAAAAAYTTQHLAR